MQSGKITDKYTSRVCRLGKSHPKAACVAAIAASGVVWYVLFGFTPLGSLLPRRYDPAVRQGYEMLAARVDSLQSAADLYSRHADLIRKLITGDLDSVPAVSADEAVAPLPVDSLPEAGPAERIFVERMER